MPEVIGVGAVEVRPVIEAERLSRHLKEVRELLNFEE
jgi:hypothetical protein